MNAGHSDVLENLIHDVNSKCSSLKSAATLLRKASPDESQELLTLMKEQAQSLARDIAGFERARQAK